MNERNEQHKHLSARPAAPSQDEGEARRKQLSRQRFLLRSGLVGFAIAGVAGYLISGDPLPVAWLGMVLGAAAGWVWLRVR
ncbi:MULTISPECIES: hypothetical protein [Pseudomonas]|uniref:hypothetical protein n=1 Tax=Pseudomonas TaxID=286 RepID=UPI00249B72A6|nr:MULTISPECIES: hypothetical protein [Pseudomonas]